jgi:hypothetical protein
MIAKTVNRIGDALLRIRIHGSRSTGLQVRIWILLFSLVSFKMSIFFLRLFFIYHLGTLVTFTSVCRNQGFP